MRLYTTMRLIVNSLGASIFNYDFLRRMDRLGAMKYVLTAAVLLVAVWGCGPQVMPESRAERDYAEKLDQYLHLQVAMQQYVESIGSSLDRGDYASARLAQRAAERNWKSLTASANELDIEASQWIPKPNDDQEDAFRPYPR